MKMGILIKYIILLVVSVELTASCSTASKETVISGTVIEAETGKPIEGAVVLVEWTRTKGVPGMTHHEIERISETETDKMGRFSILGPSDSSVEPPIIVIFKDGFVAWRNDYIFPDWKKRSAFTYQSGMVISLGKWEKEYSHDEHHLFMGHGIMVDGLSHVPKFYKALNEE